MSSGVETLHEEYAVRIEEWQTLRDVLAGSRAVKAAGERYLPALAGQIETRQPGTGRNAYDNYKQRAKFYAATGRTQQAMVGTIFHKDLVVEGPEDLLTQIQDVTLSDTPIEDFAVLALSEIVGLGRFGILVDMPDDANPNESRPYWVGYRTEQFTNWRETATNGDTYLTMVVLKEEYEVEVSEFETKKAVQFRVLRLVPHAGVPEAEGGKAYVQRIYQKASEQAKEFTQIGPDIMPMKMGQPLSFIPFVSIGPKTLSPCPDDPPLSDMAAINLSMYMSSADLQHGRHFTGLPTAVISGLPPTRPGESPDAWMIGSSKAWTLPVDAKAYYLEFTGQGLGALVEAIKECKEEMAQLGSEMFATEPDKSVETATAVKVRHSSKTASLKTIARRLATGLSKCLRWHAWWLGATQDLSDPTILAKVNTVFLDNKLTAEDLKALLLSFQAGGMAFETLYEQLEKGELTRAGVTAEQEKQAIDEEAAAAGAMAAEDAALMAEAVPPAPVVVAKGGPPKGP